MKVVYVSLGFSVATSFYAATVKDHIITAGKRATYSFAEKITSLGILEFVFRRAVEDTNGLRIQSTLMMEKTVA